MVKPSKELRIRRNKGVTRRGADYLFLAFATFAYAVGATLSWTLELNGVDRLLPPGIALMVVCVIAFFRQGKALITASSVAVYAVIIFAAFPAIYVGMGLFPMRIQPSDSALVTVMNLNFLLVFGVLLICPSDGSGKSPNAADGWEFTVPYVRAPHRWSLASLLLFGIAFAATRLEQEFIASLTGLGAVIVACVGAFWRSGRGSFGALIILGIVSLGYAEFIFSGFGRLVLAFVAIAIAIMASMRYRSVWVKFAIILGTGPVLVYLSFSRLQFLAETRGVDPSASEGIGSVVGPLISSAVIVDASSHGALIPAMGATIVVAGLFWVPRELWPEKPPGFGREIVPVTQPHLIAETSHSDAGTLVGEAVWNFGVPFSWILLLAVVLLVRMLDKQVLRAATRKTSVPSALVWVVGAASLVHLVWGGAFSQLSRVGVLVAVLAAFSAVRAILAMRTLTASSSKSVARTKHGGIH